MMPISTVPAAATGLPAIRTPIAAIADAIDAAPNAGRARTLSMIEEDIEASTRASERLGKIIARMTSAEARR